MIHVDPRPEPAQFDVRVRRPGSAWLTANPASNDFPPYWRACLDDLHSEYSGVCSYLCLYIERVAGAATVDHFAAKSARRDLAYEWTNYRLAASTMNSRKRDFSDVLDPFEVEDGWFALNLPTGAIRMGDAVNPRVAALVMDTINRLDLDAASLRRRRAVWFEDYLRRRISEDYLRDKAPFVWKEAFRQGLLV